MNIKIDILRGLFYDTLCLYYYWVNPNKYSVVKANFNKLKFSEYEEDGSNIIDLEEINGDSYGFEMIKK
jgi:hypothetical protein